MNVARLKTLLKKTVLASAVMLLILSGALVARCLYVFRDRHPGYAVDVTVDGSKAGQEPGRFLAGFGRVKINPDLSDPQRPIWLAGFNQNRPATAIHDDLWAVACVLDDGHSRLGVVALDAIGFFNDDVIEVRQRLAKEWKLDYTIICATHNHSTPDLMGLWGPNYLRTGVDPRYREQVIGGAVQALGAAVQALQPATVSAHEIPVPTAGLVADTRDPKVFDPDLRLICFRNPTNRTVIGSLVSWGNHPETVWSRNREITSDYCGYLRDGLEKGVVADGKTLAPGVGGIHLFVNGAVGGLMSTTPSITVRDPYLNKEFKAATHEKARAVGHQLVWRILPLLTNTATEGTPRVPISIRARTLEVPLDNAGFVAASVLGLLDRGHSHWMKIRTEVAFVTLGDTSIACVPGEIYPEIVNGGIERAPGGDFDVDPVEVPPIRALMPGRVKFVFGLANDEIGYIIPKSEWDRKPPYLYGAKRSVYGEINSAGPETAPILHTALRELITPVRAR